ncbi:MAG: sec-independent translocase [Actinomycetota bacterium]
MFNNLGLPEVLMLLLFGLIIFGPDQLPKIAADLGRMIRQLRRMATEATTDIRNELGPEFEHMDLASLNPRSFIEKHLLADDDDDSPGARPRTSDQADAAAAIKAAPAPYDADAT